MTPKGSRQLIQEVTEEPRTCKELQPSPASAGTGVHYSTTGKRLDHSHDTESKVGAVCWSGAASGTRQPPVINDWDHYQKDPRGEGLAGSVASWALGLCTSRKKT